jgi:hypothetical protein
MTKKIGESTFRFVRLVIAGMLSLIAALPAVVSLDAAI